MKEATLKKIFDAAGIDFDKRDDYLVLTDAQANKAAKAYILDTLWAFKPSFLAANSGVDEEVFKVLSERCEGANEAVRKLVKVRSLVRDAIMADGRGHFLSPYDGCEVYVKVGKREYYLYRQN